MEKNKMTWKEANDTMIEEHGVGLLFSFFVPIVLGISSFVWFNSAFSTGIAFAFAFAVWLGATAGAAQFGREDIAKRANNLIIKNGGK